MEAEASPGIRAPAIGRKLSERMAQGTLNVPSGVSQKVSDDRTIRTYLKLHAKLTDSERVAYRPVRWPESMLSGALPWESSRAILDLVHHCNQHGWPRPTIAQGLWFWRIT